MLYRFTPAARKFTAISCALATAALTATICTTSIAWADTLADSQTDSQQIAQTALVECQNVEGVASDTFATATNIDLLSSSATVSVSVSGTVSYTLAHELLDQVNAARAAVGASQLTWDSNLEKVAMQRAAESSISWAHTRPNGQRCFTAWPAGVGAMGENLAVGQSKSTTANRDWTNSEGHYANMINTKFNSFAAACFVTDSGLHYWVEVFAGAQGDGVMLSGTTAAKTFTVEKLADGNTFEAAAEKTYSINIGRTATIDFAPDGGTSLSTSDVTFTSSNTSVASVSASGVVTGKAAGTAKICVANAQTGATLFNTTVTVRADYLFDDCPTSAWFANSNYVGYSVEHNLLTGYSASTFGPYDSLTRGQVATILWRMAGQPTATALHFSDVDYSQYYGAAINWARATGVINGYENGTTAKIFKPEQAVTRQELCAMLYNYAQKIGGEGVTSLSTQAATAGFTDFDSVSSWAKPAVKWAIANGIITGEVRSNGTYVNPNGTAQRCAAAKMFSVFDQELA